MLTFLSFDVEFPETWKLPKRYITDGKVIEQEKSHPGMKLLSFVSDFNEEETNKIQLLLKVADNMTPNKRKDVDENENNSSFKKQRVISNEEFSAIQNLIKR